MCRHLSDADGVEVLVQLLTDSMAECRQFAAQSITSMATDGKTQWFFYVNFNQKLLPPPPPPHTHRVLSLSV